MINLNSDMIEKPDRLKIPSPEELDGFEALDPLQRLGANNLKRLLETALEYGVISETQIKGAVADFGCGNGGSSWYLHKLGADVTALDLGDLSELKELAVIPPEKVLSGDGIKYLNELPESSLDIVLAVMFGPDMSGQLSADFLAAAKRALKKDGSILVLSDIGTLRTFDGAAQGDSIQLGHGVRLVTKMSLGGHQGEIGKSMSGTKQEIDDLFPQLTKPSGRSSRTSYVPKEKINPKLQEFMEKFLTDNNLQQEIRKIDEGGDKG